MHPDLADRVTFVTGELAVADQGDRVWRTLGRPVLQKPFDFGQLERYFGESAETAEKQPQQRDGT
jgi:hypothetical protein